MGTDFIFQVKCTMFWIKRGLRVHLDLYAPDFPKCTSKYLLFSKVVRKHGPRCFREMYNFWMQYFVKEIFSVAQSFKLFQTHIINLFFLLSFQFFFCQSWFNMIWVFFFVTKTPQKKDVFDIKCTYKFFLENPAHPNPSIPSNLYRAKSWCILLEERRQCLWISFTSPTELTSSSPFSENASYYYWWRKFQQQ